jgi:small redox-active disulfide protein 2
MKKLKVLGPGCLRCERLAAATKSAAEELGMEYELEKVNDIGALIEYRVLVTPALVVDEVVQVAGRVPSVDEIKKLLA